MNIKPAVAKRIKAQPHAPSKGMPCVICGKNWTGCPHSVAEVEGVVSLYRSLQFLMEKE